MDIYENNDAAMNEENTTEHSGRYPWGDNKNDEVHEQLMNKLYQEMEQIAKTPLRQQVLDAAANCVLHDRNDQYGEPEDSFNLIGDLWSDMLYHKYRNQEVELTAVDVSLMLALMKIARIAIGMPKFDNWVDLAGYAACGAEAQLASLKRSND